MDKLYKKIRFTNCCTTIANSRLIRKMVGKKNKSGEKKKSAHFFKNKKKWKKSGREGRGGHIK